MLIWFSWKIPKVLRLKHRVPGICELPFAFLKIILFFNWSIADLQCFVSFRCTTEWFSCVYIYILSQINFFYRLLQNIDYSSLCYTVSPCWLSILHIIVYISYVNSKFLIYHSPPFLIGNCKPVFYVHGSTSVLYCIEVQLYIFF